ncbi:MAG: YegP family protein [Nitrospirales bacterium]|nr:YegP family protein [Nitrospira sp.]MDR4501131.1 YegP family protein [Nitrospirales bacterium]
MAMKDPKFEVFKGKDGKAYFRLKARSGECILASQGYHSPSGARRAIASVKTNAQLGGQYEEKVSKNGKHYFVLIAKNMQPIGKSEMFESKASMQKSIQAVKTAAPAAVIESV